MNPVGEMELLVAGIQSASEAVTTETDPGDRGVCSCVNQPVPCRVDQRHPSPLPYTQPLSVTTDIEYELDWNLFGGSEEANPSLGNKDASGVWRGALMIAATPGVPAPHLAGLPTPPEQRTTSQSHTLTPGADIQLTGHEATSCIPSTTAVPVSVSHRQSHSIPVTASLPHLQSFTQTVLPQSQKLLQTASLDGSTNNLVQTASLGGSTQKLVPTASLGGSTHNLLQTSSLGGSCGCGSAQCSSVDSAWWSGSQPAGGAAEQVVPQFQMDLTPYMECNPVPSLSHQMAHHDMKRHQYLLPPYHTSHHQSMKPLTRHQGTNLMKQQQQLQMEVTRQKQFEMEYSHQQQKQLEMVLARQKQAEEMARHQEAEAAMRRQAEELARHRQRLADEMAARQRHAEEVERQKQLELTRQRQAEELARQKQLEELLRYRQAEEIARQKQAKLEMAHYQMDVSAHQAEQHQLSQALSLLIQQEVQEHSLCGATSLSLVPSLYTSTLPGGEEAVGATSLHHHALPRSAGCSQGNGHLSTHLDATGWNHLQNANITPFNVPHHLAARKHTLPQTPQLHAY